MSNHVDAAYTKKHLANGKTKVINVLSKGSFDKKHLPGSVNIPEESPDFAQQVQQMVPDKSTPVIVHCSSMECQASTRAARKLEGAGYTNVVDFKAGLQGWQEAGNEFESGAPSATQSPRDERSPRPGRERSSQHEESRTTEASPVERQT